jgi:hypothetical protein
MEKESQKESIGVATMKSNGTIVLKLRAEGPMGILGDSIIEYSPNDENYKKIMDHLGELKPGEQKPVPPFD